MRAYQSYVCLLAEKRDKIKLNPNQLKSFLFPHLKLNGSYNSFIELELSQKSKLPVNIS